MSIKTRLKAIEGKIPDPREVDARYKPDKSDLLAYDYEEYRETVAAWIMFLYVGDQEEAEKMEKRAKYLLETLEPTHAKDSASCLPDSLAATRNSRSRLPRALRISSTPDVPLLIVWRQTHLGSRHGASLHHASNCVRR